jgi:ABC-type bacteriocin/lantibiotic exporter with double-glycine peptidase domain
MDNVKRCHFIALLTIFAACAGWIHAADSGGVWIDVPFIAQVKDGCGSATISMVLQYWAKQTGQSPASSVDPETIQATLSSRSEKGIPASAMRAYFSGAGYRTFAFRGDWDDLQRHLVQGRPLIVSLKAGGAHGPLHYAVVVGMDEERGCVLLNDPARGKMLRMSQEGFQAEWIPANKWTLLVIPNATAESSRSDD